MNKYIIIGIVIFTLCFTTAIIAYIEFDIKYLAKPLKYIFTGFGIIMLLMVVVAKAEQLMNREENPSFETQPRGTSNLDAFIQHHKNKKPLEPYEPVDKVKLFSLNKVAVYISTFLEIMLVSGYFFNKDFHLTHYSEDSQSYTVSVVVILLLSLALWFVRMFQVQEEKVFKGSLLDYFSQNIIKKKLTSFNDFKEHYKNQRKSLLITLEASRFIKSTMYLWTVILFTLFIRFVYFFT